MQRTQILLFLLFSVSISVFGQQAFASTELVALPAAEQEEINRLCLPEQYRNGAVAYRNCVNNEISLRAAAPDSALANLSFDDKYAVQQACRIAGNPSSAGYQQCIGDQISQLEFEPAPVLDVLDSEERYAIQQACFAAQTSEGAAAYRRCVNDEITLLTGTQGEDTTEDSANTPVLEPTTSEVQPALEIAAANTDSQADIATQDTRVISQPGLVAELAEQQRIAQEGEESEVITQNTEARDELIRTSNTAFADDNSALDNDTDNSTAVGGEQDKSADSLTTQISDLTQSGLQGLSDFASTFGPKFENTSKPVIAGIVAVPLMLIGALLMFRHSRRRDAYNTGSHAAVNTPAAEPAYDDDVTRFHPRRFKHTAREQARPDPDRVAIPEPELAALDELLKNRDTTRVPPESDFDQTVALESTALESSNERTMLHAPATQLGEHTSLDEQRWQSGFGDWLQQQPKATRLQHCIEFLIYWMAYGDERYKPELKKQLFSATSLDDHDYIKRWVLKQDVFAFADVITWTRMNSTPVQLEQVIGLLMALLINANSITPVQTVLLRFLTDAFGFGNEDLATRFERAYGHPLPAIPRVDKLAWWRKQPEEQVQKWNNQAHQLQTEKDVLMARLGLAPGFSEAEVVKAFRRAARRCHPDRFLDLGDRERALAERQFEKFEEARDKLLGVSV